MGQVVLLLLGALVVGAIVFGVAVLITGDEPGLDPAVPDGRVVPFPSTRPLSEDDVGALRFDTAIRGYRMAQVDAALRRAAYDLGYKSELIQVLEAEIRALREGRIADADAMRKARDAAAVGEPTSAALGALLSGRPADERVDDERVDDVDERAEEVAALVGDADPVEPATVADASPDPSTVAKSDADDADGSRRSVSA